MKENLTIRKTKKVWIHTLNRTSIVFVIAVLLFLAFSGCAKTELTEKKLLLIKYGMTEKQVKSNLGNPQKIVTDSVEVRKLDQDFSEHSSDRLIGKDPDLFTKFLDGKQELKKIDKKLENSSSLTAYQYPYKNEFEEEAIWTIYFDKNRVIWMSFP
ncbi:hypothetical protein [Candidatus Enterococcus murrayae]|uniref:Lipoprotein n=1 Tax=Candidatus Enterococcus murrayae TaxID=2815321 RepID=A0ABS3HNW6_9ENTE|nr:hypothetical protein [Enterococcus sp. MJM16]MBO0454634.1 hypothetical protein [Enterococcus sp. MJM16]